MPSIYLALLLAAAAFPHDPHSATPLATEAGAPVEQALDRDALVAEVLARNPSLAAAREALAAAAERPAQASALPDPTVSYALAPLSIASGDVDFGQRLAVEQMLPYPGKRRLRGAAAGAEAEAAGEELAALGLDLAFETALLFDDWYLVHRALEISAAHRELVAEILEVATGRYAAGLVPQQDPLQAEVELAHVLHDRVMLESRRDVVAARLNALLHRDPSAPLAPPPASLPSPARLPSPSPPSEDALAATLAARPEVRALDARIRALEAEVELARLGRRPDLAVMGSYDSMWGETEHQWMAGVAVELPIRRARLAAAEAEAEAALASARSRRDALLDRLAAEVATARLRLHEAAHVVDLYASRLLPASRDRLQAARAGFETAQSDLSALIEAERNLRTVELGHQEALADHHRRQAELARALGHLPGAATPTEDAR